MTATGSHVHFYSLRGAQPYTGEPFSVPAVLAPIHTAQISQQSASGRAAAPTFTIDRAYRPSSVPADAAPLVKYEQNFTSDSGVLFFQKSAFSLAFCRKKRYTTT